MASQLDLSGKLIIKVQLGDDIRRIPIHNEDITYDELVLMMQRVFRGKISSSDELAIKYKDEDKDLITIFDSSDLSFAIQCSRILKLTLFVNGHPKPLEGDQIKNVKKELQCIRDKVNSLLDELEPVGVKHIDVPPRESSSENAEVVAAPVLVNSHGQGPTATSSSKEFDPLSTQKSVEAVSSGVMSSFGIQNDVGAGGHPGSPHQAQQQQHIRAATPDSVSSIGSSASQNKTPSAGFQSQAFPGQAPTRPGQAQGQATVQGAQYAQAGYPQGQYGQPTGTPQQSYTSQQQTTNAAYQQQQAYTAPQTGTQPASSQYTGQPAYPTATAQAQYQQQAQPAQAQPQAQPQQAQQQNYAQAGQTGQSAAQAQPGYAGYAQGQAAAQPGGQNNPYSRGGPSYGQYPRPHGQYPQAYPASQ